MKNAIGFLAIGNLGVTSLTQTFHLNRQFFALVEEYPYLDLRLWMNEGGIYIALIVCCSTPKSLYNHERASPQPPPVCSIHLEDATAATVQRRQCAHHTPATGGEEREIEPIKWNSEPIQWPWNEFLNEHFPELLLLSAVWVCIWRTTEHGGTEQLELTAEGQCGVVLRADEWTCLSCGLEQLNNDFLDLSMKLIIELESRVASSQSTSWELQHSSLSLPH